MSAPAPRRDNGLDDVRSDHIDVDRDGAVGWIRINRPERLNSFVGDMRERLLAALRFLERDENVRCVVIIGVGWGALVLAIVVLGLPSFGRLARSVMLEQQHREYVIAARTLGIGKWTLLFRHIVPNAADPLIVNAAVFLVHAVFIEAGLSVVGLGIQPPRPSLGSLLNAGIRYVNQAPNYVVGPMLVLLLLAFGFSLLSDALNERVIRR